MRTRLLPPAVIAVNRADAPIDRERAFAILFAHHSPAECTLRIREALGADGQGDANDIVLLAEQNGQPAGALLAKLRPGRTAFVWPPVVKSSSRAAAVVDALLSECGRQLDAAGVAVGQALLEQDDVAGRDAFARNGFPYLTRLELLARSLDDPIPTPSGVARQGHSYTPAEHTRFVHLLEQTCVGSLDCAELRGAVTSDDALAVHRASGEFDPRFWLRFDDDGHDIGLVLVNLHRELATCEVNYLGIVPEFRGKGLGRALLIESLDQAKQAGFSEMILAVDEKNHFARTIYFALGFTVRDAREVHLRAHSHPVGS